MITINLLNKIILGEVNKEDLDALELTKEERQKLLILINNNIQNIIKNKIKDKVPIKILPTGYSVNKYLEIYDKDEGYTKHFYITTCLAGNVNTNNNKFQSPLIISPNSNLLIIFDKTKRTFVEENLLDNSISIIGFIDKNLLTEKWYQQDDYGTWIEAGTLQDFVITKEEADEAINEILIPYINQ